MDLVSIGHQHRWRTQSSHHPPLVPWRYFIVELLFHDCRLLHGFGADNVLNYADDESLRLWEINVEVHEAGLKLIKPGARCCDIARTLNDIYESYDLLQYRSFGYGHSFGVLCHYYGREAGLELREDIETELRPNMVISMEPMLMLPEGQPGAGGYREHDILALTETARKISPAFPTGRNITSSVNYSWKSL